ncbi:MAG: hypothetical protein GY906_28840 [bacterium]|nr:hypothetical protein [bacterium]
MTEPSFSPLADPAVRRIYVLAKVGIFLIAAALTWPLSLVIGDKAWIGLLFFGLVLAVVTATVLFASRPTNATDAESEEESSDEDFDP